MLGGPAGWGGEEVSDVIRHFILCLRAKAISSSQFVNINSLRLRKGIIISLGRI